MSADEAFEQLLRFVRESRGFDFTGYKRPSLIRRFRRRMDLVHAETFEEYQAVLEEQPHEFAELFDTILINVTSFFRDPEDWDVVAEKVIPALLESTGYDRVLRVWSAGCSSGEEAYTVAMLLAEALGDDPFRELVKIYATDVDDQALSQARLAAYTAKQIAGVPDGLRARYFVANDHVFNLRGDIRRSVIFGRNDLLQDPPISRVDLLISRNTLMYFSPDAQRRILSNFYFALTRRGFLFLGKAEALQSRTTLFEPFDAKARIFVKNPGLESEPRPAPPLVTEPVERRAPLESTLAVAAFEHGPVAEIVIDPGGRIAWINHAARAMFALKPGDLSRPLQDLELSYRPLDLRSLVDQATAERRAVSRKEVAWNVSPVERRFLDVQVSPLVARTGEHIGLSVSFTDVTRHSDVQEALATAQRSLETAYEELQSTVEELETTNEELQSTNEELETTNEELQSTNEELETMNAELQSTNEELETINDELRERTDEALQANSFLTSILSSIQQAVVVVDRELRVATWSAPASELWGLRPDEVEGEYFLNLDIGLPVGDLRTPMRRLLAGSDQEDVLIGGHDRRGRPIRCQVSFAPLRTYRDEVEGVILVMSADREPGE